MIHVKDNYYIKADEKQLTLLKAKTAINKSDGKEKQVYTILGYHTTLKSAIHALINKEFNSDIQTNDYELKDAITLLQTLNEGINELIRDVPKKVEVI